jgi:hypothetical protein
MVMKRTSITLNKRANPQNKQHSEIEQPIHEFEGTFQPRDPPELAEQ